MAGAACGVLLIVPVPLVTFTVPPPAAESPVPALVVIERELKVTVEVALLLARLTPVPPDAVLVALTLPWKFIAVLAAAPCISAALPALDNVAAPVTVTSPPPAPRKQAMPVPPVQESVPKALDLHELFWNETPAQTHDI